MTIPHQHLPVMAKEVIKLLEPSSEKVFVDATFGLGGHSEEIKKQNAKCKIIAFDLDAQALKKARKKLAAYQNIEYLNDNFTQIKKYVKEKVDGILFDLGLCSFALDDPKRGFSFQKDGPLDMRFNQKQKLTAAEIVNHYPEKKLTEIFKNYGEEHFAQRISR
ncbi:MAG: 16S rRNA (cytosine(1402)-N(4))-methyltransferase RsmH, partial [Candidatus Margulisiibacteriota bacterium]